MVQKCVICIKNPATDTPIRWSGRKGFICEACLEKSWECPDCSRLFYTGENKGYKPRHNVATGKKPTRMSWLEIRISSKI